MKYAAVQNNQINKVDEAYRQLGFAITHQATKDYIVASTDEAKNAILKDLKGEWMNALTDGTARIVAERLLVDAEGIKERIFKAESEETKESEEFVC